MSIIMEETRKFLKTHLANPYPETTGGKTQEPITIPEIEGDPGNGYWYVCGECHGYLKWHEDPCPHCGWRVNWHG